MTLIVSVWIILLVQLVGGFQINPEFSTWVGCISHHEAKEILSFRTKTEITNDILVSASIDLNLSQKPIILTSEGLCVSSSETLLATWDELKDIVNKGQGCYSLYDDGSKPWHVSTLSKSTGIPASLCPPLQGGGAPTMVLGGFTMHRIAGDNMNPMIDTAAKLSCLKFFPGASVLDTCMGLGYTAIGAGNKVKGSGGRVTTIEYDEASIEMAAHNPWSQQLFDGSLDIQVLQVK
jgi:predicted methyltransferase